MTDSAVTTNTYDREALTQLLTRPAFLEFLEDLEQDGGYESVSVLVIEVSRFGVINDSVGGGVGDKVISTTAKRLQKILPRAVAGGRLHGDQFGFAYVDVDDMEAEVNQILDFAQRPLAIRGEIIVLSIRAGVAESRRIDSALTGLVHAAEVAVHHAKHSRSKVAYFDGAMIERARSVHHLENDLRVSLVTNASEIHSAMSHSEFELYYQPIISSISGDIHAFEALLRWNHPKRGMVSPAVFIPMAEQISVMSVLGSWIIRKACADAMTWPPNKDGTLPSVSINVSPTQFLEAKILQGAVSSAIQETKIDPSRVKLEITESAEFSKTLLDDLKRLRELGCVISLDDFGTGYSSVAQLVDLPIDYVKVDRSLVTDIEAEDPEIRRKGMIIAKSVLQLADSLELTPIVEGIETDTGVVLIQALGADLIQGYVYSRPLPQSEVLGFMGNRK